MGVPGVRSGVAGGEGESGAERRAARDGRSGRAGSPIPPPPRREDRGERPADEPVEIWIRADLRDEATAAVSRGGRSGERELPSIDLEGAAVDLDKALGAPRAARARRRMQDAARAFRRGYDDEARRLLRPLAQEAPGVAEVRELYGLALYRLGRWDAAIAELEAFRALTSSTDQHPVLADCYRAVGDHTRVAALWDELREASPGAELVTEGRIVAAGDLADQGRLPEAIRLLSDRWRFPANPREHHLRRAYALADLLERAGEVPRARELFRRIEAADPGFGDVGRRARQLA